MNHSEWNGQQLGGECLALTVLLSPEMSGEAGARMVLAAVAADDNSWVIRPERLGELLLVHRNERLICHDVGPFYDVIERHLVAGYRSALEVWRAFKNDRRLFDVSLFDQQLALAESGLERPERTLDVLAREYCGIDLPDIQSLRTRLDSVPSESWEALDPASKYETLAIAQATLAVFRVVDPRARRVAEQAGVLPEAVAAWGPLSVGLQGLGAIVRHRLGRRGIHLRKDALDRLRDHGVARFRECSKQLHKDKFARRCFRWKTGSRSPEVALDDSGRPAIRARTLEQWLNEMIDGAPGIYGIAFRPPRSVADRISTSPDLWGDLSRIHPLLWAWSCLESAADAIRCVGKPGGEGDRRVRPAYQGFPQITSSGPNLVQLKRLAGSVMFEAPLGHSLLVVELRDLELRCLAEVCEQMEIRSTLADLFRNGEDPILYSVAAIHGDEGSPRDGPFWEDRVDELRQQDPVRFLGWIEQARAFLRGVARGLAQEQIRELLRQDTGYHLDMVEVGRRYGLIVEAIFPELGSYIADSTLDLFGETGHTDSCVILLSNEEQTRRYREFNVHLRDVLLGRTKNSAFLAGLGSLITNSAWGEQLASGCGNPEIYDKIFLRDVVTGAGRVRGRLEAHQASAATYLDLADDIRKVVLDAIEAPGHIPVAMTGDEIVILVPDKGEAMDCIEALTSEIRSLAEGAAGEFLKTVPIDCVVRKTIAW